MAIYIPAAALVALPLIAKMSFSYLRSDEAGRRTLFSLPVIGGAAAFAALLLIGAEPGQAANYAYGAWVVTMLLGWWCGNELLNLAAWERFPGQPNPYDVISIGWPVATPPVLCVSIAILRGGVV